MVPQLPEAGPAYPGHGRGTQVEAEALGQQQQVAEVFRQPDRLDRRLEALPQPLEVDAGKQLRGVVEAEPTGKPTPPRPPTA